MSYLKHKPGSIEELMSNEASRLNDNAYQDMFKKELDKAGKGIGSMSPKEKKDFFNKIDDKYKAKNEEDAYDKDDQKPKPKPKPKKEELSSAQKKLPAGLQKAIKDKEAKSEANDVDNGDEKHEDDKKVSTKEAKKKLHADSGSKLTKVETEPQVDYKN